MDTGGTSIEVHS